MKIRLREGFSSSMIYQQLEDVRNQLSHIIVRKYLLLKKHDA